jgi:hypothetical protein
MCLKIRGPAAPVVIVNASAPGPTRVAVPFTTISPLVNVILLQESWLKSIVSPETANDATWRRLPGPLSLQFAAT